jgi:hypothetical protein
VLSEADHEFLAALRGGLTANAYARRVGYSTAWAKKKSRKVRDHYQVATIEEALEMSEREQETVNRADFDRLMGAVGKLGDAVDELKNSRGTERPAAEERVRERELDVKDHAKALGLSLDEVEKLKEEKDYQRFKKMQDRLELERADELEAVEGEQDENGGGGLGEKIRDGLGGIRNLERK